MTLRAASAVFLIAVAAPAAAAEGDEEFRSLLERRLTLIQAVRHSSESPLVCRKLAELSQAVPPSAVLSRLAFSRSTGRWELTLSQGNPADAAAIVQRLVTKQLCSTPVIAPEGSAVTASCVVAESPVQVSLSAPKRRPAPPEVLKVLREKEQERQTVIPDRPELESYQLTAQDFAQRELIAGWSSKVGPAIPGPAVDRFELSGSGSGSFFGVAGLLCSLENGRRITGIDTLELQRPRVRNGEWVVDFSVTASTWRNRREDEQQDAVVAFNEMHAPKHEDFDFLRARSPFGPPTAVFAGSTRVLTGEECRQEGPAPEPGDRELDDLAVAFVAPQGASPCAMLVDAKGECHEVRRNTKLGAGGAKVTRIDAGAVTVTRFGSRAWDGKAIRIDVALKVGARAAPPAWFCRPK